jgi:hypothetical protein
MSRTTLGFVMRKIKPGNCSGSYYVDVEAASLRASSLIWKPTSCEPTMFYILKSRSSLLSEMGHPAALLIRLAYMCVAFSDSYSDLAPVQTILPLAKIRAVVFGSLILIMAAANRLGLYSTFWAFCEIWWRFKTHFKFAVDTMFWSFGISGSHSRSI